MIRHELSGARLLALTLVAGMSVRAVDARADGGATRTDAQPSENYRKEDSFLPGEEVRTPTGQKLKIWSTEGPVPVSRAPEPFASPQPPIEGVGVVIDGRRVREPRTPDDTFDVGVPRRPDNPRHPGGN